jgi:ectoine hydroxylase-related dioxygenase (phytanoyl-CoA dioxygenase family)
VVNPGGAAQTAHRDYHLGFASNAQAARFPAHVHRLSPVLTLQGAVAHSDMPAETGPTMYLPHSQKYLPGYLAWRRPEFREYFEADLDQPVDGLAPATQAQILGQAVAEGWSRRQLETELNAWSARRQTRPTAPEATS